METTYTIQGTDGKQYGPVTLAQMQSWIREGRIGANTQILRSDQTEWLPASSFGELKFAPVAAASVAAPMPAAPAAAAPDASTAEALALQGRIKSGASWFYWIAGLSLINSLTSLTGSGYGFIVGLGITQVIDALAKGLGPAGTAVAIVMDLLAAAVLVVFGVFANKRQAWAFIVGMVLYGLDGLIFLLAQDWLGLGFHVFVLFCVFSGYKALQQYRQTVAQPATAY